MGLGAVAVLCIDSSSPRACHLMVLATISDVCLNYFIRDWLICVSKHCWALQIVAVVSQKKKKTVCVWGIPLNANYRVKRISDLTAPLFEGYKSMCTYVHTHTQTFIVIFCTMRELKVDIYPSYPGTWVDLFIKSGLLNF